MSRDALKTFELELSTDLLHGWERSRLLSRFAMLEVIAFETWSSWPVFQEKDIIFMLSY
jgi:hypothetical protein